MRRAFASLLMCVLLAGAMPVGAAFASEFWDSVRNPGLLRYRGLLREAAVALTENQPTLSLQLANDAMRAVPGRPEAYVLAGRALLAKSAFAEAHAAFDHALSLTPSALDAWDDGLAAATTAALVGEPTRAVQLLTRLTAIARAPEKKVAALVLQADLLQAQGPEHLSRARLSYREALRHAPLDDRARIGLALALQREGELEEALSLAARTTSEPAPADPAGWALPPAEQLARRALWLHAVGDHAGAHDAYARAAETAGPWREHAERALRGLASPESASKRSRAPSAGSRR